MPPFFFHINNTARTSNLQDKGLQTILIKYRNDTRYQADKVVTHDNISKTAYTTTLLKNLQIVAANVDVIGIDEGQFFTDILDFSQELAKLGKIIIIAALDGTFERKPFGEITRMIPIAEEVVKLQAKCGLCNAPASFTKRKSADTRTELIGGAELCIPVCRKCFTIKQPASRTPDPDWLESLLHYGFLIDDSVCIESCIESDSTMDGKDANQMITFLQTTDSPDSEGDTIDPILEQQITDMDITEEATDEQQGRLKNILRSKHRLFSKSKTDVGVCMKTMHHIKLTSDKIIRIPPKYGLLTIRKVPNQPISVDYIGPI
uniref:Thymidine kinase, cytosolic n=1 Tax=Strigamia maritima TaxID=126957 RepID=T1IQG8_STRMM